MFFTWFELCARAGWTEVASSHSSTPKKKFKKKEKNFLSWQDYRLQQRTFMSFCRAEGGASAFCCLGVCGVVVCCVMAGFSWLIRRLRLRSAVEFWNWATFDGVGVAISVSPPAPPLVRFGSTAPDAPGPTRGLLTPGLAGDGGRGCSFFIRRAAGVCGPRGVSVPPASAFAEAELCCAFVA